MKREDEERLVEQRREAEEREEEKRRVPELWCDQQIPVETDGRVVFRGELGHEQRIPVVIDGLPWPGVELVGSGAEIELEGLGCVLGEKGEARTEVHERHGDEVLDR